MSHQNVIREEELKNRVAALYFGKCVQFAIWGLSGLCVMLRHISTLPQLFLISSSRGKWYTNLNFG